MSQGDEPVSSPNPYQAPAGNLTGGTGFGAAAPGTVTAKTIEMLRQTGPWVRFLSILGFVLAALMLVGGVFGGIIGLATGEPFGLITLIYIPFALIYLVPSVYLNRYAGRIKDFEASPQLDRLDSALEAQKSFWRFVGILMVVLLVAYALILVGVLVAAILGALG